MRPGQCVAAECDLPFFYYFKKINARDYMLPSYTSRFSLAAGNFSTVPAAGPATTSAPAAANILYLHLAELSGLSSAAAVLLLLLGGFIRAYFRRRVAGAGPAPPPAGRSQRSPLEEAGEVMQAFNMEEVVAAVAASSGGNPIAEEAEEEEEEEELAPTPRQAGPHLARRY